MTVTKHLRNIRIKEEKHKLCKENYKNKRVEVSANSLVLAETPKCVQQTPNKRLPLKCIAEQTCVMQHFWRFDETTFLIEIHCSANIGSLAINRQLHQLTTTIASRCPAPGTPLARRHFTAHARSRWTCSDLCPRQTTRHVRRPLDSECKTRHLSSAWGRASAAHHALVQAACVALLTGQSWFWCTRWNQRLRGTHAAGLLARLLGIFSLVIFDKLQRKIHNLT